jgi:two-component system, NarL family, nitrate/nitrite response regulator NarL
MTEAPAALRVLIADDHPIFRVGLRRLLEAEPGFVVVGEATTGTEAVALSSQLRPEVLLLDLLMPGSSGLEALRELSQRATPVRTILLAAAVEKSEMVKALQLGAWGVVLKESATELLFKAIRSVVAGQYWVGRDSVSDLVDALREPHADPPPDGPRQTFGLTRRELEILAAVVGGLTNREIAHKFTVSEETVKHHLSNIFNKVGASNRVELTLFTVHHRLLDKP